MVGNKRFEEQFSTSFFKSRVQSICSIDKKCHGRYFNIGYDHNGMTWDLNCLSPCIFEKVVSPAASSSGTYSNQIKGHLGGGGGGLKAVQNLELDHTPRIALFVRWCLTFFTTSNAHTESHTHNICESVSWMLIHLKRLLA